MLRRAHGGQRLQPTVQLDPLQVGVCRPKLAFPSDQQWLSMSELLLQTVDAIPRPHQALQWLVP